MVYTSVWFLFASAFCCCHLLIGNLWQVYCRQSRQMHLSADSFSASPRVLYILHSTPPPLSLPLPPLYLPLFYLLLSSICHSVASPYLGGFRGKRPCGNAASVCDISKWQTGTDAASIYVEELMTHSVERLIVHVCVCLCGGLCNGMLADCFRSSSCVALTSLPACLTASCVRQIQFHRSADRDTHKHTHTPTLAVNCIRYYFAFCIFLL